MSAIDLGTFAVAADEAEVAAFRRAARLDHGESVPFTYPMRWLALPQVRTAALALVPEPGLVPFHESQSFAYTQPLQAGLAYQLTVAARRESEPDRLVIQGVIAADGGDEMAKVETVLRLFASGPET